MSKRKKRSVTSMTTRQQRLWAKWERYVHRQVKQLRDDQGLTHREFAAKLGVTSGTSIRWGTGTTLPDLTVLLDMMRLFELPPAYFFTV